MWQILEYKVETGVSVFKLKTKRSLNATCLILVELLFQIKDYMYTIIIYLIKESVNWNGQKLTKYYQIKILIDNLKVRRNGNKES